MICLNAYSLRDTAFSIVFKSYHLTLKVNVKECRESYHPFVILHFSISLKLTVLNIFYVYMLGR